MAIFINATETIGIVLGNASTTLTGSLALTLFIILILFIAIALMFGIELEFTSIIIIPYILAIATYYKVFLLPLFLILFYFSLIFAKHFFIK